MGVLGGRIEKLEEGLLERSRNQLALNTEKNTNEI